jgi:molybdopterin synthase sulfur carrier subunit
MEIKILCFGITKEIVGSFEKKIETNDGVTLGEFLEMLKKEFPRLAQLRSLRVAVNEEYIDNDQILSPNQEVVLIPPVSGG